MTEAVAEPRALYTIASEIMSDWRNAKGESRVYFGAVPYVDAMRTLVKITDAYGQDGADDIVMYFLANANTWRGDTARRVKAELKGMLR